MEEELNDAFVSPSPSPERHEWHPNAKLWCESVFLRLTAKSSSHSSTVDESIGSENMCESLNIRKLLFCVS